MGPKAWGTGGTLHQLWSRLRARVYWGKERSCIVSIALTTGSLFSSSSVTALWQEWAACPCHCCVPTWHLGPVGLWAEGTALAGAPGQELHMLRAPACSCWHPACNLQTLNVFSPDLWVPPWGVWQLGCQRGDTSSFPPQLPQEGWCSLDLNHQLTTSKLVLMIFSHQVLKPLMFAVVKQRP